MRITIFEAGVIAVRISETIKPKLTSQEQGFFIAGFKECTRYLNDQLYRKELLNEIKKNKLS